MLNKTEYYRRKWEDYLEMMGCDRIPKATFNYNPKRIRERGRTRKK